MSTVVRLEHVDRYIDHSVELPAPIGEVDKARHGAIRECEQLGIDTAYDDCVMVHQTDTHLTFRVRDRRPESPNILMARLQELAAKVAAMEAPSMAVDATAAEIHNARTLGLRQALDLLTGGRTIP